MTKLYFFPYSWHVRESEIHVYGFDEAQNVNLVRITDFTPYVYVKLPRDLNWNAVAVQRLVQQIKKTSKIIKTALIFKRPLYFADVYLDEKTHKTVKYHVHPYLFVAFPSDRERKNFTYNIKKITSVMGVGNVNLEVYEHNASSVLQLTCIRNISTADWFMVKNPEQAEEKVSRLTHEYTVHWKSLCPMDKTIQMVPKPLIMSYDIECCFNDPNKFSDGSHPNDVVFQISCVFGRQSEPQEKWEKYLLTLGNPDPNLIQDIRVLKYKKEFSLLMGFNDLIVQKNPQLLIGYNIFKFDIPFMFKRAIEQRIQDDFVRHGCTPEKCKLETIKWSSSAYSNQEMNFIDLQGRMTIDVLTLIQRDFNLDSYKLDNVAEKFLGANKDPLNHHDIFMCYQLGMKESLKGLSRSMALVGKYCVKDSLLVLELFEKFQYWYSLTEMAKICQVPHSHLFLYGQQLKVFSQVYKYCYQNNIVVESGRYKTSEDDFCAGACVLTPKPGLYDNVVSFDFCLTGDTLVSMSTGCSRRLDSLILNESVLGMDQSSGLRLNHFETVRGLQVKGLRETVKLVLQDGQTIVCTPDHKIMTPQGEWVRADSLKGGYVLRGLEHPEDTTCPLEEDWAITIGKTPKMTLNMKEWREHTLALCRILGYTNLHTRVTFETLFDAQAFLNDIQRFDETTVIEESKHGVRYFINFRSGVLGVERLSFLMDPKCPLSLIREFLAGLFGGYSHDSCRMENIYLKGVSKSLINLKGLLRRLSIRSKIEEPYLFIEHSSIRDFVRAIGFRYAVRKTRKATIRMHEKLWNDEELGVEEWFVPEPRDFLDPTLYYRRKVVDVVPNGLQSVFDIEVQTAHSFVANGVVVSNCSLYPSIIISHNIDFTTLIPEDSKVELPTEQYRTIAWEEHINCKCPHATLTKDTKDVRCRKYQYRWLSEQPGVLPTIIKNLLQARKDVRNQMKTMDKSSLLYDILNKRQLAYKVSSNSMYGALSAKKGYLPFLPAGMCVTAVGRQSIEKVSKIIQEEHQGKVVYGDSVTGETPVLLRDPETQEIFVRAIGQLTSGDWFEYPGFKYFDTTIRLEKQYSKTNYEVWSDKGWTPIRRVIRHKTQKDIYTVCTRLGIVRVTEDHSLLNAAGKRLKPKDVEPGTELLHRFPEFALSEEEMEPIDSILSEYIAQQHNLCFDTPTEAQQYYLLLKQLGLHPKVYLDRNKRYSLYIEHSSKPSDIRVVRIEKDDESTLEQFVYDLETECGHFQAGVGQMIVKNTDSNYVVFPQLNSLQDIWDHSIKVSDEVSKYFPEPMRLEFEDNIYARYLILSKKRYLYFSVTPDGKMSSKIENKGVLLKRRDNSKIVRDIYEHIIRMVLNREPQDKVITQVVEFVALLYSMVPSVEDFQMSKSVKTIEGFTVSYRDARTIQYGDYVVPRLKENPVDRAIQLQEKGVVSEEDFYQGHLPGAVQLALRMRSRGQHIESGSRLSYIVSRRNTGTSVADKMEEIEYFKRYYSKQMIDVQHYLHLLINPIEEVLIVMYGPRYKNFVKDMYKYRVKYNSVINQLFHLQRPMIWETTGK